LKIIWKREKMNRAIKSFGEDVVIEHIHEFYQAYKLPIVSVGSGTGKIESMAKQKYPEIEWICVDPMPGTFLSDQTIYIRPDYDYVDTLIEDNPEIIGSCVVFLNWCYPNLDYDYEAIEKLSLLGILTIYAYEFEQDSDDKHPSIAGGEKFINWLNEQSSYETIHESRLRYYFDYNLEDIVQMEILWLNDKMFPIEDGSQLEGEYESQVQADEKGCCIC